MFSWRLVMAPPEILDYVAAHEVAHLVHMDHSARFWAQVRALMPDYEPRRDWLRRRGAALQAISFADGRAGGAADG
jgi:predicted metal-dependent hydrolase